MEVKTADYKGICRRDNGGKLKLSMSDYIKVLTIGFSLLVAGITFYIKTDITTKALAEDCKECQEADKKQDKCIVIIQGDIKYIREDMSEMKDEQIAMVKKFDENTKLLFKILGALEK